MKFEIEKVENGFIIHKQEFIRGHETYVYQDFDDVLNFLAYKFGLLKIGEFATMKVEKE